MPGTVLYERAGHVATITYNRPEVLNAINAELRQDLNAAWERFRDEEEAWVAIVTGAGRAFCAGADLKDSAGSAGTWPGSFWEIPTINSFESGLEIWKPTIAAVNGACLGYGLTLAVACDFVIADPETAALTPPRRRRRGPAPREFRRSAAGWCRASDSPRQAGGRRPPPRLRNSRGTTRWRSEDCSKPGVGSRRRRPPCQTRDRPRRVGETMRRVAATTEDATEGWAAAREHREPQWRAR